MRSIKLISLFLITFAICSCSMLSRSQPESATSTVNTKKHIIYSISPELNSWRVTITPSDKENFYNISFFYLGDSEARGPTITQKDAFSISTLSVKPQTEGFVLKNTYIPMKNTSLEFNLTWTQNNKNFDETTVVTFTVE